MSRDAARTILFVNIAHAFDHFVLLIFPTAVIAIAAELSRDYGDLIWLATGSFVAFGLFALPVGWLADRLGRRNLMATFYFGYGASCLLVALAAGSTMLAGSLLVLGVFSAIYHPVGSAMIAANATHLGRELGRNGVWGNLGAAFASGITAIIAAWFGWRAAFALPGLLLIGFGIAFVTIVKSDSVAAASRKGSTSISLNRNAMVALFIILITAIVAGGMTFNVTTIALPKVLDERLGLALTLSQTGWLTTAIFVCGALTQLATGRIIDRFSLPTIFVSMSLLQPLGLLLAAMTTGPLMLIGMVLVTSSIYGQVVVNDAMIARYVADDMRNRVYSIRYFLGFTVSGFAVPMIAALRGFGGFQAVLLAAALFGLVVFSAACGVWLLMRGQGRAVPMPAE